MKTKEQRLIVYVKLNISIHGLQTDQEAINLLIERLRQATAEILRDQQFGFRNKFDGDLEIEIEESAGQP